MLLNGPEMNACCVLYQVWEEESVGECVVRGSLRQAADAGKAAAAAARDSVASAAAKARSMWKKFHKKQKKGGAEEKQEEL